MAKQRVYIIGIDGATFRIIAPLIAQGRLPTFKHIMDNGVRSVLRSTLPANSAVAWSTFMTGKNPGKHGVFGFLALSPGYDRFVLTNGAHVRSRTLWEIASDAERRVAVINVPLTYPPRQVNGILVSGMDASFLKNFTYPPEFKDELLRAFPAYKIEFPFVRSEAFKAQLHQQIGELIETRKNAMLYLLEKTDPDLFVGVFTCTDRLQHHFWHCMDAAHPRHTTNQAGEGVLIAEMYEQIDEALRLVVERMDEQTTLLVISDHGFCGVAQRFLVNRWLFQTGWLSLKSNAQVSAWSKILRAVKRHPKLYELARQVKRVSPVLKDVPVRANTMTRSFFERADWTTTRAYYFPPGIRLNLKGRESTGVVEAAEYESARDALIQELSALREPTTGAPVFQGVYRREEIYAGSHLDHAPDLILETVLSRDDPKRNFTLGRRLRAPREHELFVTDAPTGDHAPSGILLGLGSNLKRGCGLDGAAIADIAPTVLYSLGLPIPVDMDGHVLAEMFAAEFTRQMPPKFSSGEEEPGTSEWQYDEEEEAVIRERLRDLGYLS
ncbi:MAG: alkaline phosphatase family protein [Acidobacteria bacterium]|nr:alkaline phosphatase family protein [Acidobacteriota bacterium]